MKGVKGAYALSYGLTILLCLLLWLLLLTASGLLLHLFQQGPA